jgi:ABC-type proline/glycine betaine transport system substrate-binding protein
MSKVTFSKNAIIGLADYVLKNYGHIGEVVEAGIIATKQTYSNSKLTALAVYDLLQTTAKYMQAVENEGVLKGLAKKQAVLDFIVKEYLETEAEIKQIWSGWRTTVSWFIDQLIGMLNSGRSVLQAFVG